MTKLKRYKDLSQLMDGDLPDPQKEELIELLLQDKEAREIWAHYHTIRYAMQNKMKLGKSLVERVRAAIEEDDREKTATEQSQLKGSRP